MIQPFFDDDAEMEMPCVCDCGRVFDLHDGVTIPGTNNIRCWKCGEKANTIYDLEQKISSLENDIENGFIGKREGKKKMKVLQANLKFYQEQ